MYQLWPQFGQCVWFYRKQMTGESQCIPVQPHLLCVNYVMSHYASWTSSIKIAKNLPIGIIWLSKPTILTPVETCEGLMIITGNNTDLYLVSELRHLQDNRRHVLGYLELQIRTPVKTNLHTKPYRNGSHWLVNGKQDSKFVVSSEPTFYCHVLKILLFCFINLCF